MGLGPVTVGSFSLPADDPKETLRQQLTIIRDTAQAALDELDEE